MLFLVEDDIENMNKYRINFYTLIQNHDANASKQDYIKFVNKFYPNEKKSIEEF